MSTNVVTGAFTVKYAPKKLSDVVFSSTYAKDQIDRYAKGLTRKPIMLYGTYGTGKSLIAELLPYSITPDSQDFDLMWMIGDVRRDFATKISTIETFAPMVAFNNAGIRVAVIDDFREVLISSEGKKKRTRSLHQKKGHREELEAFIDALARGGDAPISWDEMRAVSLASILAVRSLREGTPFDIA